MASYRSVEIDQLRQFIHEVKNTSTSGHPVKILHADGDNVERYTFGETKITVSYYRSTECALSQGAQPQMGEFETASESILNGPGEHQSEKSKRISPFIYVCRSADPFSVAWNDPYIIKNMHRVE